MAMLTENDMQLPAGKTCADCRFFSFCVKLFGCDAQNTTCDWAPSRFKPRESKP
jgi:hypothetical protein